MSATPSLRLLTPADRADYDALYARGLAEHPECFRSSPEDDRQPTTLGDDREQFTMGAFSEGGTLLGVVRFGRERHAKMRHKGLLYRMYVRADAAGCGLGRALVREALTRARTAPGLEQITLTVVASNAPARQLYISEGFVPFALERRALKVDARYLDEEQMVLDLRGEQSP